MQGVDWAIPKEMFELLGGRLTGSLAVSFIPTATILTEATAEERSRPSDEVKRA
jgi:hypothetical protein